MIIVKSRNGVPIRLTQERWQHIVARHPEIKSQKENVLETVALPDLLQEGDLGSLIAAKFYPRTPLTRKFLVVVYRELTETDGFVLTAYFTNRPSDRRRVVWKL